jgi:hypothetical protein
VAVKNESDGWKLVRREEEAVRKMSGNKPSYRQNKT